MDSLNGLIRVKYPHYALNIVLGTASGFLVGLIVGAAAGPNNGDENFYVPSQEDINALTAGIIIGPLVGAATGILISVANNKNKYYDLAKMDIIQKEVKLKELCSK